MNQFWGVGFFYTYYTNDYGDNSNGFIKDYSNAINNLIISTIILTVLFIIGNEVLLIVAFLFVPGIAFWILFLKYDLNFPG